MRPKKRPKIIYLFIDGIGLGKNDLNTNPFTKYAQSYLSVLGGVKSKLELREKWYCIPTDPNLGVKGIAQSATGQCSLWTGVNGPLSMGFHKTGFPGPTLIEIINKFSIIKIFKEQGLNATLLNAYSPVYLDYLLKRPRYRSVSSHLQLASGQKLLTFEDLKKNKAIYMDYTLEFLKNYYPDFANEFEIIKAEVSGKRIVELVQNYDLVIHEFFLSDKAGHKKNWELAKWCIETIEKMLNGLIENLDTSRELLLITSDHGNMEDLSIETHTQNLVPTFAYGYNASLANESIKNLTDIVPFIYEISEIKSPF